MRILTLIALLLPAPALAHPDDLVHLLSLGEHGPHAVWYALIVVGLALIVGLGLRRHDARVAKAVAPSDRDAAGE